MGTVTFGAGAASGSAWPDHEAVPDRGRLRVERRAAPDRRWELGRAHLGLDRPPRPIDDGTMPAVAIHGDPWTAEGGGGERPVDADTVRTLYRESPARLARALRGAYAIAIADAEAGRLVVVNDRLGSHPVYWWGDGDRLVFSPSVTALQACTGHPVRLDGRSLGDLLKFGFVLGSRTLSADVSLLPPASVLVADWRAGTVRVERWGESIVAGEEPAKGTVDDYRERVRAAFNAGVRRATATDHEYVISLSGGLDSRALLSAASGSVERLSTYTSGLEGCADEVLAARLTRLTGTGHRFFPRSGEDLDRFAENMDLLVGMTDGMYLSHGATEINDLRLLESQDYEVLLRGHGGELVKMRLAWPLHTDPAVDATSDKATLVEQLLDRIDFVGDPSALGKVLRPAWQDDAVEGPRRSLDESLEGLDLSPARCCAHLYLYEHHRRFTVASLEVFRHAVDVRMPFVDEQFLEAVFDAPASWHDDTGIHRAIISGNAPALARVRNSNTGAPVTAPPWLEFGLDKVNSLLKRLNVRGYRHYHQLDRWLRERLLEIVSDILLDQRSLDRGICEPDGLREIVEQTRSGARDHGYLLQALLMVELWHRRMELGGSR